MGKEMKKEILIRNGIQPKKHLSFVCLNFLIAEHLKPLSALVTKHRILEIVLKVGKKKEYGLLKLLLPKKIPVPD